MPEGHKTASAEGQSPPQELEEGPRSRPHLLVALTLEPMLQFQNRYTWSVNWFVVEIKILIRKVFEEK